MDTPSRSKAKTFIRSRLSTTPMSKARHNYDLSVLDSPLPGLEDSPSLDDSIASYWINLSHNARETTSTTTPATSAAMRSGGYMNMIKIMLEDVKHKDETTKRQSISNLLASFKERQGGEVDSESSTDVVPATKLNDETAKVGGKRKRLLFSETTPSTPLSRARTSTVTSTSETSNASTPVTSYPKRDCASAATNNREDTPVTSCLKRVRTSTVTGTPETSTVITRSKSARLSRISETTPAVTPYSKRVRTSAVSVPDTTPAKTSETTPAVNPYSKRVRTSTVVNASDTAPAKTSETTPAVTPYSKRVRTSTIVNASGTAPAKTSESTPAVTPYSKRVRTSTILSASDTMPAKRARTSTVAKTSETTPATTSTKKAGTSTIASTGNVTPNIPIPKQGTIGHFLYSLSADVPHSMADPEAVNYRINFESKKEELAWKLLALYNREVFSNNLPDNVKITWDVKHRTAGGFCFNRNCRDGTREWRSVRIGLSPKILDRASNLRDTMAHELCHAAAWVISRVEYDKKFGKTEPMHGRVFQSWAAKVAERFPEIPPVTECHNYPRTTKYTYRCTSCGYSIGRESKSLDLDRRRCGICRGTFELWINRKKRGNTETPEYTTKKVESPRGFALFVKEHYGRLRKSPTFKNHADVMKMLSHQYDIYKRVVTPGKKQCQKCQCT